MKVTRVAEGKGLDGAYNERGGEKSMGGLRSSSYIQRLWNYSGHLLVRPLAIIGSGKLGAVSRSSPMSSPELGRKWKQRQFPWMLGLFRV
jgi:hypothetical protein